MNENIKELKEMKAKIVNSKGEELTGRPSVDMPHLRFFPKGSADIELPKMSLYDNIYERNVNFPKDTALEYFGNKITYDKLFDLIDKTAKSFYASGIRKGDTVSVVMPTIPELVYCLFALIKLGVNMDTTHFLLENEEDIYNIVKRANPNKMILLEQLYGKFKSTIDRLPVDSVVNVSVYESVKPPFNLVKKHGYKKAVKKGEHVGIPTKDDRFETWAEFLKSAPKNTTYPTAPYESNRNIIMANSSGTTGTPKGINLSDDGINASICYHEATGMNFINVRGQRYLNILPSIFTTTLTSSLIFPLAFGANLILDPRYDAKIFADQITKYKPNFCIAVAEHWEALLSSPVLNGEDLSYLNFPIAGGSALSPELEKKLNEFFEAHTLDNEKKPPRIRKGWGLSEWGAANTLTHEYESKIGSVGKAFPHIKLGIFNPDTNEELGYNEVGEIRGITPSRMIDYEGNPKATEEIFKVNPHDGLEWGYSGDLGMIDEDGDLYIVEARGLEDSIKNEENRVYAYHINSLVSNVEGVEFCKTVKSIIFDEELAREKEIHVTHIKLSDNIDKQEMLTQIHDICNKNLEHQPFAYNILDEIPIASSGKKDIIALRNTKTGLIRITNEGINDLEIDENNIAIYSSRGTQLVKK